MNILVACEESQVLTIELRKLGHSAFSCDILDCSGFHPEWHIKCDVLLILDGFCNFNTCDGKSHFINSRWDMIFAFPPCTFLTNAGACRMFSSPGVINSDRYNKMLAARKFFMSIYNAPCNRILIENPVPMSICDLPAYNQIIDPSSFGHKYKKRTCLWLKGLPELQPTFFIPDAIPCMSSSWFNRSSGHSRQINRSKTFSGIASAFAIQYCSDDFLYLL